MNPTRGVVCAVAVARPAAAADARSRRARPCGDRFGRRARPPRRPAACSAYVTNEDSEELSVIDTAHRQRGRHHSGRHPAPRRPGEPRRQDDLRGAERIAQVPADHARRGVREAQGGQDARTASPWWTRPARKVTRVLPGGSDPENFDISRDGSTLFISNEDAGAASVVDMASGQDSLDRPGREGARGSAGPARRQGGLGDRRDRSQRHDPRHRDRQDARRRWRSGSGRASLAFTPDGKRAYVTSEVDGTVWVIDAAGPQEDRDAHDAQGSKPMGVGGVARRQARSTCPTGEAEPCP